MKSLSIGALMLAMNMSLNAYAQNAILSPGQSIDKKLSKGETHLYTIHLSSGEYATCIIMQKGIDLAIDLTDPTGKKIKTFDSPNGDQGPEPIEIIAAQTGDYKLHVYHFVDGTAPDPLSGAEGNYSITDIIKLTASEYKMKLAKAEEDKTQFSKWINNNAHALKTVDAGNGFEDLQIFKQVLKDVIVIGLGEASHGTSEFFKMKHRMLEFLVKEMGVCSFYIEASMTRCRYINDYVLYGKGNLDTATAIQGFVTWRVEEVKNMIAWMREYNATVPAEKKVKFYGYDLQINDLGWKALKQFYHKVDPSKVASLDNLNMQLDSASTFANIPARQKEGTIMFKKLYPQCMNEFNAIKSNRNAYESIVGKEVYEENLMNMKLITQEAQSYSEDYSELRDLNMEENILYLLGREKPNSKVVVWAHNGHIAKNVPGLNADRHSMGGYLNEELKDRYYAIGFEFYSGSFQTRNMDINNKTANWDVMSVGEPPVESLPWYFNKVGKDKFFIDFRNTGADKIKNFSEKYQMHSFGSMNSSKWPTTYSFSLNSYDGMIYIKTSTAAKNFNKVMLKRM